ncbi:MAG: putative sulfate exporter family transporter [Pirellulales bacterium]
MNESPPKSDPPWWATEDWLAVGLGSTLLIASFAAVMLYGQSSQEIANPLAAWLAKPQTWLHDPFAAFSWEPLTKTLVICLVVFGIPAIAIGIRLRRFAPAFVAVFLLAGLALALSTQATIKFYNLEYALWALLIGLAVSNTVGAPEWLRPSMKTELYIKTGLVLLGAKVLFNELLELGPRGLAVAWVVTPIVLVTTYWFGQRVLRIESKTLNIVVSADMAVCGVSAAIATAAACRAKKEELSLAIGISMAFTVLMMMVMPPIIRASGMDELVGGAWIGGTIDSTGAVVAAGEMVGPEAGKAAITIKMIQNILIGVVAFGVAIYWVRFVERGTSDVKPDAWEIWRRFPKFVIGFLLASAVFSILVATLPKGQQIVDATVKGGTEILRDWFFSLAFVSIGLESNFRELAKYLRGGKPVILYACGQSLNLTLTLLMAWLVFG